MAVEAQADKAMAKPATAKLLMTEKSVLAVTLSYSQEFATVLSPYEQGDGEAR